MEYGSSHFTGLTIPQAIPGVYKSMGAPFYAAGALAGYQQIILIIIVGACFVITIETLKRAMEFSAIVPPAPDADSLFDDIFFSPIVDNRHNAGLLSLQTCIWLPWYLADLQRSCLKRMTILMQLLRLQGLKGVIVFQEILPHKLVWWKNGMC